MCAEIILRGETSIGRKGPLVNPEPFDSLHVGERAKVSLDLGRINFEVGQKKHPSVCLAFMPMSDK